MSANKSGNKDFSGGVLETSQNKHYETRSRSTQKPLENKNDTYHGYESANSKKQLRKAQQKPPVEPHNRRVEAARQNQLREQKQPEQPQPQVVVASVAPLNLMDLDLDSELKDQAARHNMANSNLRDPTP